MKICPCELTEIVAGYKNSTILIYLIKSCLDGSNLNLKYKENIIISKLDDDDDDNNDYDGDNDSSNSDDNHHHHGHH